jgi:hypothetical protein
MDYPWLENLKPGQDPLIDLSIITIPIEETNGLLNLIWHPHNIVEAGFSDLWNLLISYVQSKNAYHDTLNNIIKWWDKRASLSLLSCGIADDVLEIVLQSDILLENMCLEIYSPDPLEIVEGLEENGNGYYRLVVPRIEAGERYIRLKRRLNS